MYGIEYMKSVSNIIMTDDNIIKIKIQSIELISILLLDNIRSNKI